MHIHPICLGNITRSVWAEAFGRRHSREEDGFEFSSSGTMAKTWQNLDELDRITYIASVALELARKSDNDFSYDLGKGFRQGIERAVEELDLENLDVQRLSLDRYYYGAIQRGLRRVLVDFIAPHEKFIRNLAMKELGVDLPPNTNSQTVYDSSVNLYLAMSDSIMPSIARILDGRANGKILTASEYSGINLEEPRFGVFACANMDTYLDYVGQIERVMKGVVDKAKNGNR